MPSPGSGMPSPGGSSGGSPSPSGGSSDGGASGSSSGGAGDVGAIPPSPDQGGGGGGFEGDSGGGAEGGGDGNSGGGGEENPFGDADSSDSVSECGDTGALPGGIGGMGREGECLSSESPSASESDSESESESSSSAADSGGGGGGGGGSSGGATTGTGGAGSVGEFPQESSAERAERLGRQLDESIGGFDETLGEEQREIAAAGRIIEGYDMAGEGGQGSGGLISLGGQTASENQSGSVGGGGGSTAASEPLAGLTQDEIAALTPEDIPTMVDDDIIARQLREAAIVEKNLDLRDRLWDEYRKYKGLSVSD